MNEKYTDKIQLPDGNQLKIDQNIIKNMNKNYIDGLV